MIKRQLDSLERRLGESVDYLRHVARTSTWAFMKLMGFLPLAAHRGTTAPNLLFAAQFVATQHEDCGTCLQIVVNQALRTKVSTEIVAAMITGDPASVDAETALVAEFTRAVLHNTPDQEQLRNKLRRNVGEIALLDISLAIASARFFPTLKRSLGYAVSCQAIPLLFSLETVRNRS